ncbi:cell division protein FtsQ/DivIB [Flavobacterium sp.]|uniref:cell division protein FtsQ/DivIB n=1 Tax=Flavobacterium sp. TaxID=239 RepID=UPI0037BE40ED
MKFLNWINLRLALMLALVVFLYSFTSARNSHRKLLKTEVTFVGNQDNFISFKTVNKLLIENKKDVQSIAKSDLNLKRLENLINKNPMVEKAQVFVTIDGVLKAVVKQRVPIARVFDGETTYYIDYEGNKMPLSNLNTARVLLFLGEINTKNKKQLTEVLKFVYDDDFLKKNIVGMELDANNDLQMTNRNFDYQIEFGKMIYVEKKFKNYKAFFQKAVLDSSLYKYKKINLRFNHQVVCTK